jgi:hypothetical protein
MFGWSMKEKTKLAFTITVNWRRKDGSRPDDAIWDGNSLYEVPRPTPCLTLTLLLLRGVTGDQLFRL